MCGKCDETGHCVFGDVVEAYKAKMLAADGIILASPVYFGGIAGTMKCFLDRVFGSGNDGLRHKVGAGIAVVRRSGGMSTLDGLNHYLSYCEMAMPASKYWNIVHGLHPGEVEQDLE